MNEVALSVCVVTDNPNHLARAVEVLGRALAGLALEGIDAHAYTETLTNETVDEETP